MQTIFVILTTLIIVLMAKKRGRSLWRWGLIGAVVFLVIDTIFSLLLFAILWDSLGTTESIYIFAAVKLLLSGAVVAVFSANLKRAAVPPPSQASVEGELTHEVPPQKAVSQSPVINGPSIPLERPACSNCGKALDPNWLHCGYCGQKVIKAEVNPNQQDAQRVVPPTLPKPAPGLSKKKTGSTKGRWSIIIAGICVLLIVALVMFTAYLKSAHQREEASAATSSPATETYPITEIFPTSIPPSPVQALVLDPTQVSPQESMVLVPEGEFQMGSTESEAAAAVQQCIDEISSAEIVIDSADIIQSRCEKFVGAEKPNHTVWLDTFWIDQTEVTNAMYGGCVAEGSCIPSQYADNSDLNGANQPVIGVDWTNAAAYCAWAGRRLPTEAEWEKAARGSDGRAHPWGNQPPNQQLTNFLSMDGNTAAVGSFPAGASPYGALDMAGNVKEWVADWYGETYYATSAKRNPPGPESGEYRVQRGGYWNYTAIVGVRAAYRAYNTPDGRNFGDGFRCASSSPDAANPPPAEEPPAAGEWAAVTDFGKLILTMDPGGTKITKMVFLFSNWECGPLPASVQAIKTATIEGQWPIAYGGFSIFNYIDNNTRQSMTLNGVYDPASKKFSGTWEESSYGTRCSGIWEAGAPE